MIAFTIRLSQDKKIASWTVMNYFESWQATGAKKKRFDLCRTARAVIGWCDQDRQSTKFKLWNVILTTSANTLYRLRENVAELRSSGFPSKLFYLTAENSCYLQFKAFGNRPEKHKILYFVLKILSCKLRSVRLNGQTSYSTFSVHYLYQGNDQDAFRDVPAANYKILRAERNHWKRWVDLLLNLTIYI